MAANRLELVRQHGLKATPQRLAVLDALMEGPRHPSAEELHARLKTTHPSISLSTVYSNLASFKEAGLVEAITLSDKIVRWDVNTDPHVNFVCLDCRQIMDVDTPAVDRLIADVRKRTPHEIIGQKIEVFGRCGACRKNPAPQA
jgi:Fur family transcriptional regulator, peroxide stress response regulator